LVVKSSTHWPVEPRATDGRTYTGVVREVIVRMSRRKPAVDLVVRLVGPGIRPWEVPTRALTQTLQAVQGLLDSSESGADLEDDRRTLTHPRPKVDSLFLLKVTSGSAAYQISTGDAKRTERRLRETASAVRHPEESDWAADLLTHVKDLSQVATKLGCVIEFRSPGPGRAQGDILARIEPDTYSRVKEAAFIQGDTSVFAKVVRVGGATDTRCGLRIPEHPDRMIYCSVANKDLGRSLGRYLYEYVVVSGLATWFRSNWRLHTMQITGCSTPKGGSIADALSKANVSGGNAWDSVADPHSALLEQRG